MKAHLDIRHEGTLGSENRTRMTFDENSITHLMTVLTDLYSDPEKAVIREYASNAWDSHIAAGTSLPIEIELPTPLNPVFVVTDFGVGLSTDEVVNHLSKYGWSSKRDTNEAVGMLGLGFKSALTYTSQFTLVARKAGVQCTVLVTREESGAGVVQVIDECDTDEPNGVTIQVPVRSVHTFNQKANFHFRFWEPGTVLVDGEKPEPWDGSELDPDVLMIKNGSLPHDYIVMGNVPYPTPIPMYVPKYHTGGTLPRIIARVPIGCVNFTPSREALQMTKRTEEVLQDTRKFVMDCVVKQAQDELDACTSHVEALKVAETWARVLRWSELTYKGEALPSHYMLPDKSYEWSSWAGHESPSSSALRRQTREQVQRALHVYNYKSRGVTKVTKAKVRHWLSLKPANPVGSHFRDLPSVFFYPGPPIVDAWIADARVVDYDEIQAVDLPDHKVPIVKARAKYSTLNYYGDIEGEEELTLPNILWFESSQRWGRESLMSATETYFGYKKVHVVSVPSNRQEKFKKDFPHAEHVGTWVKRALREFVDGMTEADRWVWFTSFDEYANESLRTYIPRGMLHKVMDTEYRDVIAKLHEHEEAGRDKEAFKRLLNIKQTFAPRGKVPHPQPIDPTEKLRFGRRVAALIARYPLLAYSTTSYHYGMPKPTEQDRLEYLNTTYIVREQLHLIRTY